VVANRADLADRTDFADPVRGEGASESSVVGRFGKGHVVDYPDADGYAGDSPDGYADCAACLNADIHTYALADVYPDAHLDTDDSSVGLPLCVADRRPDGYGSGSMGLAGYR